MERNLFPLQNHNKWQEKILVVVEDFKIDVIFYCNSENDSDDLKGTIRLFYR